MISSIRGSAGLGVVLLVAASAPPPAMADEWKPSDHRSEPGTPSSTAEVASGVDSQRSPSAAPDGGLLGKVKVTPYAALVGGVEYETIQSKAENPVEDRGTTIALSRLGLKGDLGHGISIESEFEINAGPHGTSVWEGQAAIQVRNQLIRVQRDRLRVDVGRITDDSSLDYYSEHVADQLLTDGYTRGPLLASGFNRGNGVLARYEVRPGLQPGISINAANPTATTASLVVGGTFPPFARFYFAPWQQVGRDASKFPADEYHIVMVTPSVVYRDEMVEAQGAVQFFRVNTNTATDMDQPIDGFNVRLGAAAHLLEGRLHPFANFSVVQNEVVDPDDGMYLSGEVFRGITATAGVDLNYQGRNGFGISYAQVRDQQGESTKATQHFVNLGSTYWLAATTSVGARLGVYVRCEDLDGAGCPDTEGERSFFMTLRTIL